MMMLSLLIGLFSYLVPGPQIPNFYRSFPTARAESAKAQKDMLIFFSSSACPTCLSAWSAYSNDAKAVLAYVSTQVETDNFDGQILYEHFDPGQVPAWVILDHTGKVKERWQGGWKDIHGKGTLYAEEWRSNELVIKQEANEKPVKPSEIKSNASGQSSPLVNSNAPENVTGKKPQPTTPPSVVTTPVKNNTTSTAPGFVIQAGYFGSVTNAEKCLADLKSKGFNQFSIHPLQQNGTTFYRVWSETVPSEHEAQAKLEKLASAGIKGTVKSSS